MKVSLFETANDLRTILPEWEDLALHAGEHNCFYEPWMVLPALEDLPQSKSPIFLVISDRDIETGKEQFLGFFPVIRSWRYSGLYMAHFRMWRYAHCLFCNPLVRRGHEIEVVGCFLNWWKGAQESPSLFLFNEVERDSVFLQELRSQVAHSEILSYEESHPRAIVERATSFQEYEQKTFSLSFQEELRKKRRELEALGEFQFRSVRALSLDDADVQQFLRLEQLNFKGPELSEFLKRIIEQGNVQVSSLWCSERCVAASIHLMSDGTGFSFKSVFDFEFKKCSPSLLLEVEYIRFLHEQETVFVVDTCRESSNEIHYHPENNVRRITDFSIACRNFPEGFAVSYVVPVIQGLKSRTSH
ncbi:MAG: GNAT family N-acetyltransferase [Bdellovibrionales bacterium]|nr:GNAT family N-acetyltransferase [Bdellovibrionales bacterium]